MAVQILSHNAAERHEEASQHIKGMTSPPGTEVPVGMKHPLRDECHSQPWVCSLWSLNQFLLLALLHCGSAHTPSVLHSPPTTTLAMVLTTVPLPSLQAAPLRGDVPAQPPVQMRMRDLCTKYRIIKVGKELEDEVQPSTLVPQCHMSMVLEHFHGW